MPAHQTAELHGLQLTISPDYWLRRLFHFPFYFEHTNPTFRIDVKRVNDTIWDQGIGIQIVLANGSTTMRYYPVPHLDVGESARIVMEGVASHMPGRTTLILPTSEGQWQLLYAYAVSPEDQLWTSVLGPLLGAAILAGGAVVQKWIGLI